MDISTPEVALSRFIFSKLLWFQIDDWCLLHFIWLCHYCWSLSCILKTPGVRCRDFRFECALLLFFSLLFKLQLFHFVWKTCLMVGLPLSKVSDLLFKMGVNSCLRSLLWLHRKIWNNGIRCNWVLVPMTVLNRELAQIARWICERTMMMSDVADSITLTLKMCFH